MCIRDRVHTPEDLKGLKIRTPESEVFLKTFELLGTNPTPVSYTHLAAESESLVHENNRKQQYPEYHETRETLWEVGGTTIQG